MAPSEQAQNRVARDQVKKAVASLQKHVRARASQKPSKDLLGEERQFLYVIVALKKVPERVKPTPSSMYHWLNSRMVSILINLVFV